MEVCDHPRPMKAKLSSQLARSMAGIASSCPSEALGPESRYVVVADLRMGDGGKKDCLARARKAIVDVLGGWYLPQGYTLVLAGDVEDLRSFWLRDIVAAWPELYAAFNAFKESKRLRKIVGDRDLALTLLKSYPYELSHGLRLEADGGAILILHGHQASQPYVGRDYLKEYLVHWQCSAIRRKDDAVDEDGKDRFKAERRLYRASRRLGLVTVEGHTRRPLFESRTSRESVRFEVERLLREGDPRDRTPRLDELIETYRRAEREGRGRRPSGEAYDPRLPVSPCLFSPGRIIGGGEGRARELRMLEIEGERLSLVRWAHAVGAGTFERGGRSYLRRAAQTASIGEIQGRVGLLAAGAPRD
jgi:hypothetical protein